MAHGFLLASLKTNQKGSLKQIDTPIAGFLREPPQADFMKAPLYGARSSSQSPRSLPLTHNLANSG